MQHSGQRCYFQSTEVFCLRPDYLSGQNAFWMNKLTPLTVLPVRVCSWACSSRLKSSNKCNLDPELSLNCPISITSGHSEVDVLAQREKNRGEKEKVCGIGRIQHSDWRTSWCFGSRRFRFLTDRSKILVLLGISSTALSTSSRRAILKIGFPSINTHNFRALWIEYSKICAESGAVTKGTNVCSLFCKWCLCTDV